MEIEQRPYHSALLTHRQQARKLSPKITRVKPQIVFTETFKIKKHHLDDSEMRKALQYDYDSSSYPRQYKTKGMNWKLSRRSPINQNKQAAASVYNNNNINGQDIEPNDMPIHPASSRVGRASINNSNSHHQANEEYYQGFNNNNNKSKQPFKSSNRGKHQQQRQHQHHPFSKDGNQNLKDIQQVKNNNSHSNNQYYQKLHRSSSLQQEKMKIKNNKYNKNQSSSINQLNDGREENLQRQCQKKYYKNIINNQMNFKKNDQNLRRQHNIMDNCYYQLLQKRMQRKNTKQKQKIKDEITKLKKKTKQLERQSSHQKNIRTKSLQVKNCQSLTQNQHLHLKGINNVKNINKIKAVEELNEQCRKTLEKLERKMQMQRQMQKQLQRQSDEKMERININGQIHSKVANKRIQCNIEHQHQQKVSWNNNTKQYISKQKNVNINLNKPIFQYIDDSDTDSQFSEF